MKCIDCRNWEYDPGCPDYSDYTPGKKSTFSCIINSYEDGKISDKILFYHEGYDITRDIIVNELRKERTCKYFKYFRGK